MAPWIDVAGWTLLHFIWQGAAIAVAAAIGLRLLRAAGPSIRYGLAGAAMVAMLVAPAATATRLAAAAPVVMAPISTSAIRLAPTLSSDAAPHNEAMTSPGRNAVPRALRLEAVLPVIVMLWLAGVALLQLRLLGGWWHVKGLHRASLASIPSEWQARVETLAMRLGVQQLVRIVEARAVDIPSVIGWWRPIILLPIGALAGLTPTQADAILVHELAHIRRHDYLANALQHVAETLLFYHPAVWWISRRMRIEREHCCDAVVVRMCGDPIDYAVALVELEAGRSARPALAVAATDGSLVQRIRLLLGAKPSRRRPLADALVTAFVVVVLVVVTGGGYRWAVRASVDGAPRVAKATPAYEAFRAQDTPQGRADIPQPAPAPPRAPGWRVYATEHFEIFFTPGMNAELAHVEREAERAYRKVSGDLRHDLSVRPNLVLFATGAERERGVAGGALPGTQSKILLALDRPDDRFRADVTHEVTHEFEFDILPARVPSGGPEWIWEGLAEHEGELWAAGDDDLLRGLVRANRVPALSAFENTSERRLPYAVGHAAFDFIAARWGLDGIRQMLFSMRQRQGTDRGVLYYAAFGLSAEAFDQAFEQYLRDWFPTASAAPPLRVAGRITLTVPVSYRENQIVFLGDEPVRMAELEERLRKQMDTVARKEVLIRGDGALDLSDLIAIADVLKAAGVDDVAAEADVHANGALPGRRVQ
jgi:beta-lactamase regulating signal transducer with metallopeptidase domain